MTSHLRRPIRVAATPAIVAAALLGCPARPTAPPAHPVLSVASAMPSTSSSTAASAAPDPATRRACDEGATNSCNFLEREAAAAQSDPKVLTDLLKRQCDEADYAACAMLADRYAEGIGTAKDAGRAVGLYELVCLNGYYGHCATAAGYYREGREVPKDLARAQELERQAFDNYEYHCHESRNESACTALGVAYLDGVGTARSEVEAASAFERACDGGDAEGCYRYGRCRAEGVGVTKDPKAAARLYEKACTGGYRPACAPKTR